MPRINHDALAKTLVRLFLFEMLELFAPRLHRLLIPGKVEFLNVESLGPRLRRRRDRRLDQVAKVFFRDGRAAFLLIHLEFQSQADARLGRRVCFYSLRLHEEYDGAPVYPIALLAFDLPRRPQPDTYGWNVGGKQILEFRFHVIQLNRLRWQQYVNSTNPVALALMTRMGVQPHERVEVKKACLRQLGLLELPEPSAELVWTFAETYLPLDERQQAEFQAAIEKLPAFEKEKIMRFPNTWRDQGRAEGRAEGLAKGRAEGRAEGLAEGQAELIQRLLRRRFGTLPADLRKQIKSLPSEDMEALAEALLDFQSVKDLRQWLARRPAAVS
jgi:hypothetical protein